MESMNIQECTEELQNTSPLRCASSGPLAVAFRPTTLFQRESKCRVRIAVVHSICMFFFFSEGPAKPFDLACKVIKGTSVTTTHYHGCERFRPLCFIRFLGRETLTFRDISTCDVPVTLLVTLFVLLDVCCECDKRSRLTGFCDCSAKSDDEVSAHGMSRHLALTSPVFNVILSHGC